MRLLFDQNISHRILQYLPHTFANSTSVKTENLIDSSDRRIWEFAKEKEFTIVTQDSDFNDLNVLFGYPPKVIWIRTGNLKTDELSKLFHQYEKEIVAFLANDDLGCLEIINFRNVAE